MEQSAQTQPGVVGLAPAAGLNLKVRDSAGDSISVKVKLTTPICKIMDAYCGRKGFERAALVFLFDGQRVTAEDTPGGLEMEDGDVSFMR